MICKLHHDGADVLVTNTNGDKRKVTVDLTNSRELMPVGTCETTYSIDLIEKILEIKGPTHLCDEITRDESPGYIERHIHYDVFGYIDRERFKDKRILDFGCGSGASTMVLSRMLPDTTITGVDLEPRLLEIAELRAKHYELGAFAST